MRRFLTFFAGFLSCIGLGLGAVALAQQAPNASAVPLQWNITLQNGVTTAVYPGNESVLGTAATGIYTVAGLPTCNAAAKGQMAAVSDATTPTYNATLTGGGAVSVPVYCNGSAWTSH